MELREFELTIAPLRPQIFAVAMQLLHSADDADDIAQETLLKMWSIRSYLDCVKSPMALASTIARHKAIDLIRHHTDFGRLDDIAPMPSDGLTAEDIIIATECRAEADQLMAQLPNGMRTVLKMRHIDGLDTSQIAAILGSREPTVRVSLSRARQRIRQLFEEQNRNHQ